MDLLVFLAGALYFVVMLLKLRGTRIGWGATLFVDACGGLAMYTYFGLGFVEILVLLLAADFLAAVIRGTMRGGRNYY